MKLKGASEGQQKSPSTQVTRQALDYAVDSTLVRLDDLHLLGYILNSQRAELSFAAVSSLYSRLMSERDSFQTDELYILFTKFK